MSDYNNDRLIELTNENDRLRRELAEAREWIEMAHQIGCRSEQERPCDCGRDALLAALEGPK